MRSYELIRHLEEGAVLKMERSLRYKDNHKDKDFEYLYLDNIRSIKTIVLESTNKINTTINRIEDIIINPIYWSVAFTTKKDFKSYWETQFGRKFKYTDTIIY